GTSHEPRAPRHRYLRPRAPSSPESLQGNGGDAEGRGAVRRAPRSVFRRDRTRATMTTMTTMTRMTMNKPLLGLCLGALLGALDGASAWFYPDVREHGMLAGIVLGSMGKGLVAGLVTGFIARKLSSVPLGILAGFLVFALITLPIAMMENEVTHKVYFFE